MDAKTGGAMRREAIGWIIRMREARDADWQAFEQWLGRSPDHVAAYREIEDLDLDVAAVLADIDFSDRDEAVARAANDDHDNDNSDDAVPHPARRTALRWLAGGGALAAAVFAAIALTPQIFQDRYEVRTAPGQTQIVDLEGGTRVIVNGGSSLVFDRSNPRFAELSAGEALFEVHHDSSRPFRVLVHDRVVEDAGTVFNLAYDPGSLRLAVADGKVIFEPGAGQTELAAGEALETSGDGKEVVLSNTDREAVGGWRKGVLTYRGEPLSRVAADLSRLLGMTVTADASIAARPYFGTIAIKRGDAAQLQALMTALDVEAVHEAGGITMKPAGHESP